MTRSRTTMEPAASAAKKRFDAPQADESEHQHCYQHYYHSTWHSKL